MMMLIRNMFKKQSEATVVTEPMPDFTKQMTIIEPTSEEKEDEDESQS